MRLEAMHFNAYKAKCGHIIRDDCPFISFRFTEVITDVVTVDFECNDCRKWRLK